MAIDTERKRKAIVSIARPWHPPIIVPDGTLNAADRGTIGRGGSGIIAAGGSGGSGFMMVFHHHHVNG